MPACAQGAKGTVWRGLTHAPWSATSLRDGWTVSGAVLRDGYGDDDGPMLALAVAGGAASEELSGDGAARWPARS